MVFSLPSWPCLPWGSLRTVGYAGWVLSGMCLFPECWTQSLLAPNRVSYSSHQPRGGGVGGRGESLPACLMWKPKNHLWGLSSNGRCLLAIDDSNSAPQSPWITRRTAIDILVRKKQCWKFDCLPLSRRHSSMAEALERKTYTLRTDETPVFIP